MHLRFLCSRHRFDIGSARWSVYPHHSEYTGESVTQTFWPAPGPFICLNHRGVRQASGNAKIRHDGIWALHHYCFIRNISLGPKALEDEQRYRHAFQPERCAPVHTLAGPARLRSLSILQSPIQRWSKTRNPIWVPHPSFASEAAVLVEVAKGSERNWAFVMEEWHGISSGNGCAPVLATASSRGLSVRTRSTAPC